MECDVKLDDAISESLLIRKKNLKEKGVN